MPVSLRLFRAFLVLLFATAMVNIAMTIFDLPVDLMQPPTRNLVFLGLGATLVALFLPPPMARPKARAAMIVFAVAILSILPFYFTAKVFGTRDMSSILLTLSENQAGEMVSIGLGSFTGDILRIIALMVTTAVVALTLVRLLPGFRFVLIGLSVVTLATGPLAAFAYRKIVPNPAFALIQPDRDLLPPQIISKPLHPKNLIILYLESTERTYRELAPTKQAFTTLAAIEDEGMSARNQQQAFGTHFTAGGIVASQCGVPLLPRGMFSVTQKKHEKADINFPFEDFLPSLTCLGDILQADGYSQSYLNGSDVAVYSKGDFFLSHGFETVIGLKSLPNWQTEPRTNLWGMDDDLLFEQITDELHRLAGQGKPFTLAALTLSTHGPDAFLDKTCAPSVTEGSLLPDAIRCTSAHVQALIDEVARMGLADQTVIVVMSDHLAMHNALSPYLDASPEPRRNLVTILGAGPARVIERPGSTLDLYPTLLEALGYQIAGGRAYLGRSLLQPNLPTLTQSLGIETLNAAIDGNTDLQRFIWQ